MPGAPVFVIRHVRHDQDAPFALQVNPGQPVSAHLDVWGSRTRPPVLTCSALKKSYRSYLRVNEEVKFVYLRGSYELIANQLRQRHGHFMNPELLQSQFATLEQPEAGEDVIIIELGRSPRELVDEIKNKLNLIG